MNSFTVYYYCCFWGKKQRAGISCSQGGGGGGGGGGGRFCAVTLCTLPLFTSFEVKGQAEL